MEQWNGKERRKSLFQNGNLMKLREVTKNLPFVIDSNNGYREYRAGEGTVFSWILHRIGNALLVQRWFMSAGSIWKEHSHKGIEVVFIYEGSVEITTEGKTIYYHAGDTFVFGRNILHSAYYKEDTKGIVILFDPIEEGYVNGK